MRHRLFLRRHSFSSGRSFPSGPRTFERSDVLGVEDEAVDEDGVEDLEFFEAEDFEEG